ncbi:hypothetical protein ACFO4E_19865 [Nocardiopsis mangrovi]|uniref:DUF385 domain-containing protein n=1 Tax=Nocardiopsis mangrovi TaxID=1179818 RepID=A0ABV9DZH3_9ACTN
MRRGGELAERAVTGFNSCVLAWRSSPRWGPAIRRRLTIVTYTGRRSGKTFSTPVAFRQRGDTVTIGVRMPDAKAWWRNFSGDGGPISLELSGSHRTGHAVSRRDDKGRVTVTVHLDRQAGDGTAATRG